MIKRVLALTFFLTALFSVTSFASQVYIDNAEVRTSNITVDCSVDSPIDGQQFTVALWAKNDGSYSEPLYIDQIEPDLNNGHFELTIVPNQSLDESKTYVLSVGADNVSQAEVSRTTFYGDVNGDGALSRNDLTMLAGYFAGQSVTIDIKNTDVDANGNISRNDLVILSKYFSGWDIDLGQ